MEFVGRKVRKEFEGYGVFSGVVKSYDSSSGFFEIGYDDGDSEEIDFPELAALMDVDGVLTDYSPSLLAKKPSKRRPKKRRRVFASSNSGNGNDFYSSIGNASTADGSNLDFVEAESRNEGTIVDNLTKKLEVSSNNNNNVDISCSNLNSTDGCLDLKCGVHDLDNNGKGNDDENDLNLDLHEKGDYPVKKERCFDLNMDLDHDENNNQDVDLGGYLIKENSDGKVEENQNEDSILNATSLRISGDIATENLGTLVNQTDIVSPVLDHHGSLQKTRTAGRDLKKRKITNSPINAVESGLRRSARRRAMSSTEDHDLNAIKYDDNDDVSALPSGPSPVMSAVSVDQPTTSGCEESEAPTILPPKLNFPESTGNVNLDGLPVLDLFSVYAFLRSFSTILFLSPFELGDFVAALRSKSPSLLIDSIHVSLLRTLRKHLEFQLTEGSTSAINCLRDLNWDLLDLITWPTFMAEYLLMKPSFDLAQLKLFKTDYHKQPEFVKLELLQYICDDVIESEVISSELNRRIIGEPNILIDPDLNSKLSASKKRRATTMAVSGSSCMSEEVDETADWNSDECCLCKMDGNLICCDGCPAAFHSKCVGIASNLLPEGDWFCPECVVGKKNPEINVVKSIRGAELLGVDPHGRLYYSSCGYLLVSDVCDAETMFHYYHMNDLTALINALNLLNGPYKAISNAITKHWRLYDKLHGEKSKLDSENASEAKSELERPLAHSAGSSEISEAVASIHIRNSSKTGVDSSNVYELSKTTTRKGVSQQLEVGYLNLYSFARVASLVAREWTRKPSEKTPQIPTKSLEELISVQMKSISKTSVDFCWANIKNLTVDAQKEKCGWCLACKFPTDDGNCLFFMSNTTDLESFNSESLGFGSRVSKNDHLIDIMCHILYIEDRLHGLLLGPWLNPHFPKIYRKSFLEASNIVPLKELLLTLESNIWLRALSDDWLKHVDSAVTVGSAAHIVTSKLRMPSRNVIGKKRSKSSDPEPHSSKNASSGLGLYWWRGGRLTRKLFNWKVLPRSLACKAARQGGGKKINGILYPENSDFPKRSKAHVWRASVESAVTVEQVALQIRELDANIKWEEIENSSHLAKMDKESIKSMRSFKKAIIRRKSSEGAVVKYLLDFGKRRFIPDTVIKYGTKIEESSDRKKYWVEEPYVPLFLLKTFEDRRIALKSNKMTQNSLLVSRKMLKKSNKVDFEYLFSKAEKSENHLCGHCNKDVLVRDAISCAYCEGFFHKRHIRKTSGGTYTCHKCHLGQNMLKPSPKKGKSHSRKTKKVSEIAKKGGKRKQLVQAEAKSKSFVVPLRRSARTAKVVSLQGKNKLSKKKKKKQPKSGGKKKQLKSGDKKKPLNFVNELGKPKAKRGRPRKIKKEIFQKKRSHMHFATYWFNGFLLSRKPDDDRVADFQTKNHLVPFQPLDSIIDQPTCSLCHEPEFRSSLNYITCGTCGDWYHGDAFGFKEEHIGVVIEFKCHKCRERVPPVCPHLYLTNNESKSGEEKNNDELSEVLLKQKTDTIEEPNAAETVSDCKQDDAADAQSMPESTHDATNLEKESRLTCNEPCVAVEQNGSLKGNESDTSVDVVQREANEDCGEAVAKRF